jgi:micrococcal nuclease
VNFYTMKIDSILRLCTVAIALSTATLVIETLAAEFAVVRYVIDGDTVVLSDGEKIRYIGINSPEINHPTRGTEPYAQEASKTNRKLVQRRKVKLVYDIERTDKYGRTLAYVWADTTFVNAHLIRQGLARAMIIPPNTKYEKLFRRLEQEARRAGRGMWRKRED